MFSEKPLKEAIDQMVYHVSVNKKNSPEGNFGIIEFHNISFYWIFFYQ